MRSGARQILEPVLAEVGELELDERGRRGRDEHLPAVAGRGDPRGAVHVLSDVALVGEQGRPGVQADPHLDRPGASAAVSLGRGRERTRRGREGDEEGVALGVDLDPAVARAGLAHHPPVLGQRLRVGLGAELVQEPRRALDVGEEEGDGAGREIAPQGIIMRQSKVYVIGNEQPAS